MMSDGKVPKFYLTLFLIGFVINLIWEVNQMRYFADKPGSTYLDGIFYCSLASIIDGLIVVLIYFFTSKFFAFSNLKFYFLTALFGSLAAISFEAFAFHFDLWSYKKSMPIVPFLNVGLLPFVQLISLVPFSIFLSNYIFRRGKKC